MHITHDLISHLLCRPHPSSKTPVHSDVMDDLVGYVGSPVLNKKRRKNNADGLALTKSVHVAVTKLMPSLMQATACKPQRLMQATAIPMLDAATAKPQRS